MIKIGYGQSNFESMVKNDFHYVDRTNFIALIEEQGSRFLFFLRPRRFGKSLFISTLEYYYGLQYKEKFDFLFGKYFIGKTPTPLANSYLVLKFDFSGIDTTSFENTEKGFLSKIHLAVQSFSTTYADLLPTGLLTDLLATDKAETVMGKLFTAVKNTPYKIYLLIDGYDHFANELVSFNLDDSKKTNSGNGFVQKFYETIKTSTGDGVVDRMFVTGVSPVTVDSLTSGFNIARHLSLDLNCHNLMGFTEGEVAELLRGVGADEEDMPQLMKDMKRWYNGYLFNSEAKERLYNSDMVLYFANFYGQYQTYPDEMLGFNIASDYSKICKLFGIGGLVNDKLAILDKGANKK